MNVRTSQKLGLVGTWLMAMSSINCATEVESIDVPDRATLLQDSRTMSAIFEARANKRERSMPIDLTDDREYQFVRNRLLAAGKTPENSPHVFELLEQGHEGKTTAQGAASESLTANSEKNATGQTPTGTAPWTCGHFLLLEDQTNKVDTRFLPSVVMSCFDGASYSYLDGALYRKEDPAGTTYTFLTSKSVNDYISGRNVQVDIDPVLLGSFDNADKALLFDSLAIAEKNGVQQFTYATVETMGPGGAIPNVPNPFCPTCFVSVPEIKIDHPKKVINSKQDPNWYDFFYGTNFSGRNPYKEQIYYYAPDGEATDPWGNWYGDRVRMCLDRGYAWQKYGQLDCDYAAVNVKNGQLLPFQTPLMGIAATSLTSTSDGVLRMDAAAYWPANPKYDAYHRYIPIKGSYELFYPSNGNCTIDSFDDGLTQAELVLYEDGGFCEAGKSGDTLGISLSQAMQPNATKLKATFNMLGDFGGNCWGSLNSKRSHFYVMVYAKTSGTGVCGNRYTTKRVTPVDFLQSCFAEGTEIRRADGKVLPVEQFHQGDKVIANGEGLALTVTGVVHGSEHNALVNLYDDQGHDLFVTEMHPIVTVHRGVVKAKDLTEGDEVMTDNGPATLMAVTRVAYDRPVFNLSLGTTEELARAGKENRTMFAEGYLVGDNEMQVDLEMTPKPLPTKVESKWERDYQSDKARNAIVAR